MPLSRPELAEAVHAALDAGGGALVLTNVDSSGAIRSRPVTVWVDDTELVGPLPVLHVLTGADARKADALQRDATATLAGPVRGGWFAAGGRADVIRDPSAVRDLLARLAPGLPSDGVAVIRITVLEARRWSVRSVRPFDNVCTQLLGAPSP